MPKGRGRKPGAIFVDKYGKRCPVCTSKNVEKIETELLELKDGHLTGEILADMSKRYRIAQKYIKIHRARHLGKVPANKKKTAKVRNKVTALQKDPEINQQLVAADRSIAEVNNPLDVLKEEAEKIRIIAMEKGNYGTALMAIDRHSRLIETQVKIAAEMRAQEMHNEAIQKREWAKTQAYIWKFMKEHGLTREFWDGLEKIGTTGRG